MAARGDVVKKEMTSIFFPISEVNTDGIFVAPDVNDCCVELPLLASTSDTDPLKNDVTRFLRGYDAGVTSVLLFLTKLSDSSFVDVALVDDTYGEFFAFGFHTDDLNRNYIGYRMDWRTVLTAFGEGTYQIKAVKTMVTGDEQDDFDFSYCLGAFTPSRADGTIRLQMNNSYILGSRFNVKERITFPSEWINQVRVTGYFGYPNSDYDIETTKFRDGSLRDIKQQQVEHFKMRIEQQPILVHDFIKTEFWQSDEKLVTDYNRNNYGQFIDVPVRNPNEYKPRVREDTQLATVDVECDSFYDNFLKKYC